ncbi:Crp/Fnr family transcriptional regulator [Runella slithyformis]|uniref:Transcriptional regulator, Crp/Fnr family n=1 Tax=Runella slithyformis (strain ATCC 29530 / DSM 19594 / LMG 11500 / NCIMB 11436 / LSU 4) TaxID=761193 RepID=A0A7U3ZQT4_RUNSL|nr:Crp/Fnr family transcriptional regulator [Runella slithyformis]AEI51664.1 putative transcriptional regulator, Crp/Fnr family [Runella slithyformis DSM 19594]
MSYLKLGELLNRLVAVTAADMELAHSMFEPLMCGRNELLVEYGKVAKYMYFVNSGFIRSYHLEKGVEITNHLAGPNTFVTSYNSFTAKILSDETVQTIAPCDLLRITKDNLDRLYRKSHHWALVGIMMADKYLIFNNQRGKDLITLSAEERYLKLMQEEPALIQNVPLQYIASYIGIEPQTLSRIRRKIIS